MSTIQTPDVVEAEASETDEPTAADQLRAELLPLWRPLVGKKLIRNRLASVASRLIAAYDDNETLMADIEAIEANHETELAALHAAYQGLADHHQAVLRAQQLALILIFDMQAAIQGLTSERLSAPARSGDGQSVRWENQFFTVTLDVFRQPHPVLEIVPAPVTDAPDRMATRALIGPRQIEIIDGQLPVRVQDEIIGFAKRLVLVGQGEQDPGGNTLVFGTDGSSELTAA